MKRKYLIATHGELAKGFQSSLDILTNQGTIFEVINAYMTDEDYTMQIIKFIESIGEDEQAVIFTDIFGGSVNQKVVTEVLQSGKSEQVFIVSNSNLAIILSIMFSNESQQLTNEFIHGLLEESQVTLVPLKIELEDNDEDFF